ncbi:hypothetical protein LPJ53_006298 [Coemansia erecta]|uniref:Uncharacterized protein n=1 Tax=Coemansia erecta TaxID=147472 RepID=A0A9W8CMU8_9FUNG|nr:hypothetical protein LPJ53_006298 [Coemansia erecta]
MNTAVANNKDTKSEIADSTQPPIEYESEHLAAADEWHRRNAELDMKKMELANQRVRWDAEVAEIDAQQSEWHTEQLASDTDLHDWHTELLEWNNELLEWNSKLAAQDAKMTKKDAKLKRTRETLAKRDAELARLQEELAEKDAELARMRDALAKSDVELAHSKTVLAGTNAEVDAMHDRLAFERSVYTEALAGLNDQLEAEDADLTRTRDMLTAKREEHVEALAEMGDQLAARDAEITDLNDELAHTKEMLANVDAKLANRDAKLAHMRNVWMAECAEHANVQASLVDKEFLIRAHQHRQHQLQEQVAMLAKKVDATHQTGGDGTQAVAMAQGHMARDAADDHALEEHFVWEPANRQAFHTMAGGELVASAGCATQPASASQQHVPEHCQVAADSDEMLEEGTQAMRQAFDAVAVLHASFGRHDIQLPDTLQGHYASTDVAAKDMAVGAAQANGIQPIDAHTQSFTNSITMAPDNSITTAPDNSTVSPQYTHDTSERLQAARDYAYTPKRQDTQSSERLAWSSTASTPHETLWFEESYFSASSVDGASGNMHVADNTPELADGVQSPVAVPSRQQLHGAPGDVARMVRKRPSPYDTVDSVDGTGDEMGGRPVKRPRTGQARVLGASDGRMDGRESA